MLSSYWLLEGGQPGSGLAECCSLIGCGTSEAHLPPRWWHFLLPPSLLAAPSASSPTSSAHSNTSSSRRAGADVMHDLFQACLLPRPPPPPIGPRRRRPPPRHAPFAGTHTLAAARTRGRSIAAAHARSIRDNHTALSCPGQVHMSAPLHGWTDVDLESAVRLRVPRPWLTGSCTRPTPVPWAKLTSRPIDDDGTGPLESVAVVAILKEKREATRLRRSLPVTGRSFVGAQSARLGPTPPKHNGLPTLSQP